MAKKIRFLFEGNFEIARRDYHFAEGDEIEADDADATRLITGLCAEEVNAEPKPKAKAKPKTQDGE